MTSHVHEMRSDDWIKQAKQLCYHRGKLWKEMLVRKKSYMKLCMYCVCNFLRNCAIVSVSVSQSLTVSVSLSVLPVSKYKICYNKFQLNTCIV